MEDILKNVLVCFCPYTESQWGPVLNNLRLLYSKAMQMRLSLHVHTDVHTGCSIHANCKIWSWNMMCHFLTLL